MPRNDTPRVRGERDALTRTIEKAIETRIDSAAAGLREEVVSREVRLQPLFVEKTLRLPRAVLESVREDNGRLRELLANPPRLENRATVHTDGRETPLAFAILRGANGETREGIEVRLRDRAGQLLDRAATNRSGLAVLRFPGRRHLHDGGAEVEGVLELADGTELDTFAVPAHSQFAIRELKFEDLEDLPADVPIDTAPFGRLPTDFTTETCDVVTVLAGRMPDPIFSGLVPAGDFRSERTPLIKKLSVIRLAPPDPANPLADPKRYLVGLRQVWTFIGYTLGELADVTGLDPGAVLNTATETVRHTTERVSQMLDRFVSQLLEETTSTLRQGASVDSVIGLATSTAAVGGGGAAFIPLPFPMIIGGGGADVDVSATTTTRIDTSLSINSRLHFAKSLVNEAVRSAMSTLRSLESTLQKTLQQVSPLLSRVTNLLRWVVYENYAVCTHVEDVHEIDAVELFDLPDLGEIVFSAEQIVEYRPFFEPALLEPQLRSHFAVLRRALEAAKAGSPISTIHLEVVYSSTFLQGDLRVTVGNRDILLPLHPNSTIVHGTIRIPPIRPQELAGVRFSLAARMPTQFSLGELVGAAGSAGVTLQRIRFWFDTSPAAAADQEIPGGELGPLTVNFATRVATAEFDLTPAVPAAIDPQDFLKDDPLFRHINTNRSYYLGILGRAAQRIPSLRFDAPQLQNVPQEVWRLPIVGFEGHRIVVIRDADPADPFVARLLSDPGAATLIQIAAPGAYAEALQGILSLTDALGKVHPALIPAPAPVMPPLALVDLTGKQLQVIGGGAGTGTGTGTGTITGP